MFSTGVQPLIFHLFTITLQIQWRCLTANADVSKSPNPANSLATYPLQRNYNQYNPNLGGASLLNPNRINEVPRLPVWNNSPNDGDRHIDFTQLFEIMGEPRGSRGRELSELISRPKPKCNRKIRIINGVTRIRERGSLARFQCSHGFTLIGPTVIVCLRDRWSEPPPICVRSGCRPLRTIRNGISRQSVGGAVATFYCLGNSQLIGDPVLYCDGLHWNGTEPTCHKESLGTTTPEPISTETENESDEEWPVSVNTPSPNTGNGESQGEESWDMNSRSTLDSTSPFPAAVPKDASLLGIVTTEQSRSVTVERGQHIMTERNQASNAPTTIPMPISLSPEPENMATPPTELPEIVVATTAKIVQTTARNWVEPVQATTFRTPTTAGETNETSRVNHQVTHTTPTSIIVKAPPTQTSTRIPVTVTPKKIKILTRKPRPRRPPNTRRTSKWQKPSPRPRPQQRTTNPSTKAIVSSPPPVVQRKSTAASVPPETNVISENSPKYPQDKFDYTIAIDKEPEPSLEQEHVAPIRPIILPDMLHSELDSNVPPPTWAHVSVIIGTSLSAIGLGTFSAAIVLYCWRKNKGIARARPYDMDGRTLSAHDANDDFMWLDQRDSGL